MRHNIMTEKLSEADSARRAQTSISVAEIGAAASKYGADTSAAAARYGANTSASASRYSADSSASAARYSADSSREASKYSVDTKSLDAYKDRLTNAAQKGYDRQNAKDIEAMREASSKALKQIDAMQKQLDRNSNEYIALEKLKETIRKNDQDFSISTANTIISGVQTLINGVSAVGNYKANLIKAAGSIFKLFG